MSFKKKQSSDERFLRVQKDPRFWEMPEKEHKIKIDKRFQSMFHDKRFKVKYTVDKRGRPINHTSTEDLKRFYQLSDSEEEEEEDEEEGKGRKAAERKKVKKKVQTGKADVKAKGELLVRGVRVVEEDTTTPSVHILEEDEEEQQSADDADVDLGGSVSEDTEEESDEEEEGTEASGSDEEESGLDSGEDSDSEPDLARGRGNIETSSDEDEEDDVDAILRREEEEIEHDWGELCKDAVRSDEVSARLAVCNIDWDRLKAKDLLVLFGSFVPKGGAVLSVKIYPSGFGKERFKEEETKGPLELRALPDDSEDDTEEERVYREKMRDYQFKRLKYFYAVVECDSVDTAAKIYEECDGYEYESSCSVMDLRFIPDDLAFDEEPKDVAMDVNVSLYTPKLFTSSAAASSKVQLTWDETDHERVTALNRKFNKDELLDMDFKAYLASSSEEEDGEEQESEEEAPPAEEEPAELQEKPQEEEENMKQRMKKNKKSEDQISKYRELLKGIKDKEKKLQDDKGMEMEITWVPGLKESTEEMVRKKLEGTDKLTPWEDYLQRKKDKKKKKKQRVGEEELSDDELPPDVDLSDPFFSEELGASEPKKKQKGRKRKEEREVERTAEEEEELEQQKAEIALLMEDDDKHKHFNYDKIVEQQNLSKKKKKKLLKKGQEPLDDDDFQVDVKDPRFQAMFSSHLFNLDPSHPSFKKTKATQSILAEKQRRRDDEQCRMEDTPRAQKTPEKHEGVGTTRENDSDGPTAKRAMDPSLSLLVKSIKNKTEQFQARKKQKVV
ncbi:ESF1 homolog [Cololabis saira]|uniref:ESF1 homolog n=1 Tax=Cololabis saira TaxID=129043 RepID=UPI002AD262AD|nr:ESF1 homolog [Cololabis saira]